jgi:hypothetical protein
MILAYITIGVSIVTSLFALVYNTVTTMRAVKNLKTTDTNEVTKNE